MDSGHPQLSSHSSCASSDVFIYSPRANQIALTKFIIQEGHPLTLGEEVEFVEFCKSLNPAFTKVPKNVVIEEAFKLFETEKEVLKQSFQNISGNFSLTSDIWTSKQDYRFICVTAHYLDTEWLLQKRILCLKPLEFPPTKSAINGVILQILREFSIHNRIFSISFDDASNNTACLSILKTQFQPILEGRLFHTICACNVVNLIVEDCLQNFQTNLENIRTFLLSLNTSSNKQHEFKILCAQYGFKFKRFVIDVPHRWNSTYLMLKSCIRYKDVITHYISTSSCSDYQLTENDWLVATPTFEFLELFYNITYTLSGVYYPTSPLVLTEIINISHLFAKYRHVPYFDYVVIKMEAKFLKYWSDIPLLYCLAAVLDPKIKLDGVFILLDDFQENMNIEIGNLKIEIKECLDVLISLYGEKVVTNRPGSSQGSTSSNLISKLSHATSVLQRNKQKRSLLPTQELSLYLNSYEDNDYESYFSILEWWKEHEKIYPILFSLARDILMVPVSTVASKYCFSAGSRMMSKKRSRMVPEVLEVCVCVQDWIRAEKRIQHFRDESVDVNELDLQGLIIEDAA